MNKIVAFSSESERTVNIEQLSKGEYFKVVGGQTVYVMGEYNRFAKKYQFSKHSDISFCGGKKKGTKVLIGFTF